MTTKNPGIDTANATLQLERNGRVTPQEALEVAAKALARHKWPTAIGVWESFGQGTKDDFRDQARAALEATAPYIRAEALESAAAAIQRDGDPRDTLTVNWLKARAGAERSRTDAV